MSKIDQPWPCQSKRSMVNMGFGVAWAAPLGLALVGPGAADLVTKDLYTQEEWTPLLPSTFYAAQYAGRYVASYDVGVGARGVLSIDRSEFAVVAQANSDVTAFYGDPLNGKLYAVVNDVIYEWDADSGQRMVYDWLSREFVFPALVNLTAARVEADFTMAQADIDAASAARAAVIAANAIIVAANSSKGSMNVTSLNGRSLNGSLIQALPPVVWDSLVFQLYTDGKLRHSRTLTDAKAFRLPAGYRSDNATVRVSGNVTVRAIQFAESMESLGRV